MNAVVIRGRPLLAASPSVSLVRQGLRVPLPDDLASGIDKDRPAHPIKTLIRNGFRRNKRESSHRLIVSALKNGYRYLNLLSRAAEPSSPEHSEIITFIRENNARILQLREKTALAKANAVSTAPIKGRTPLIKRVSGPDEPPQYEPTGGPRPLETLPRGVRKPPTLNETFGVPFLRFYKPQPRFLERVVRQRSRRRQKRIHALFDIQTYDMELARWEDEWEWLVEQLQKKGKVPRFKPFEDRNVQADGKEWRPAWLRYGHDRNGERSFEQALWDTVVYLSDVTNKEREDMAARGRAMWQIVLAEKEQALEEKKRWLSEHGMGHLPPKPTVWRRPVWASKTSWKHKGAWVRRKRVLWKRKQEKSQEGLRSEDLPEMTVGQEKAGLADGSDTKAGRAGATGTGNSKDWQKTRNGPDKAGPIERTGGFTRGKGIETGKRTSWREIGLTPEKQTEVKETGNRAGSLTGGDEGKKVTSAVVNRPARKKRPTASPNHKASKKAWEG
ncbi:hypothetical protein MMYC01_202511 [Madurella mycetomatis]|uniref:Uncharacterized protein n=1 Tax=Madurella mycetomatis TaxID=100816 RepID=A0A175WDC3_9PEZI|nr:hypothetical protein MMYC01_202511 [Madurella mycetomatis]